MVVVADVPHWAGQCPNMSAEDVLLAGIGPNDTNRLDEKFGQSTCAFVYRSANNQFE